MTIAAYLKLSRWMGRAFGAATATEKRSMIRRAAVNVPAPLLVSGVHVRRTLEPEDRVLGLLAPAAGDRASNEVR